MKGKRVIALGLILVALNHTFLFAAEEMEELYHTELPETVRENAELLTLEEAVAKTIANSTALKKANANLKQSEEDLDNMGNTFYYNGDQDWSILLNLIKSQASYSNAVLSKEMQEKNLRFSMMQAYISLLNAQREVALTEQNLKNEEQDLVIARSKAALGLLSAQELAEKELAFTKSKTELDNKKKAIEEEYASLNTLMGEDRDKVYQLELPLTYETLTPPDDLDQYVQASILKNESIKQSENEYKLTQDQLTLYHAGNGSSYATLETNVKQASLSLADAKKELENKIRSNYNAILELEESIENNQKELITQRSALEVAQTKYDRQLITELALNQAKEKVAQIESTIIGQIYEHMLLLEKYEDSSLL